MKFRYNMSIFKTVVLVLILSISFISCGKGNDGIPKTPDEKKSQLSEKQTSQPSDEKKSTEPDYSNKLSAQDFGIQSDNSIEHSINSCIILGKTDKGLILGLDLYNDAPVFRPQVICFTDFSLKPIWKWPEVGNPMLGYALAPDCIAILDHDKLTVFETETGNQLWNKTVENVRGISLEGEDKLTVDYYAQTDQAEKKEMLDLKSGKLTTPESKEERISGMHLVSNLKYDAPENFIEMRKDGKALWKYKTKKVTYNTSANNEVAVFNAHARYFGNFVIIDYSYSEPMNYGVDDETLCLDASTGKVLWSIFGEFMDSDWDSSHFATCDITKKQLLVFDVKSGQLVAQKDVGIYKTTSGIAINGDRIFCAFTQDPNSEASEEMMHCYKLKK